MKLFTSQRFCLPTHLCVRVWAAVKFPRAVETAWLLSSTLGFFLDVFVYHTFSLLVRSIMKLLVSDRWYWGSTARGHFGLRHSLQKRNTK